MIILVTGLPGAGKTLYTVSELLGKEFAGRPIYQNGIKELALEHEVIENPDEWENLPDGSVVVIDEVQRFWPTATQRAAPLNSLQALNTHRHRGFDFVVITQDQRGVNHHLRRLVTRHIHLSRPQTGSESATVYTWGKATDPEAPFVDQEGDKKTWSYPKASYGSYKSAEVHTVTKRIPHRLKVVGALALVFLGGVVFLGYNLTSWLSGEAGSEVAETGVMGTPEDLGFQPVGKPKYFDENENTPELYAERQVPREPGRPWSAPMFAAMDHAVVMPKPACIATAGRCVCYTQQATRLHGIPTSLCRTIVRDGWFDYTQPEGRERGSDERI